MDRRIERCSNISVMAHITRPNPSRNLTMLGSHQRRLLVRRAYGQPLQLRRGFARAWPGQGPPSPPPMARILKSGKAAGTRLRLYLSLLYLGRGQEHDLVLPARSWALIIGLPHPDGSGARAIRSALAWLEREALVTLTPNNGAPTVVRLREETGSGAEYTVPGQAARVAKEADQRIDPRHLYLKVPAAFWEHGWIAYLSVPALVVFLALLTEAPAEIDQTKPVALPESKATTYYQISADTLRRGVNKLEEAGVIRTVGQTVGAGLDFRRRHNLYVVSLDRLQTAPPGVIEDFDGDDLSDLEGISSHETGQS